MSAGASKMEVRCPPSPESSERFVVADREGQGNTQTDANGSRPAPCAEQATPYALRNARAGQPEVRTAPPQLRIFRALRFT